MVVKNYLIILNGTAKLHTCDYVGLLYRIKAMTICTYGCICGYIGSIILAQFSPLLISKVDEKARPQQYCNRGKLVTIRS